jgi:hypothetical protein
MDCKNAVYTPPQGEKAAKPDGGIYLKYAADLLIGGRFAARGRTVRPPIGAADYHPQIGLAGYARAAYHADEAAEPAA